MRTAQTQTRPWLSTPANCIRSELRNPYTRARPYSTRLSPPPARQRLPPPTVSGYRARQIQCHADGNKEQPEQEPFKRLNGDLQLMAILAFSQQNAGDEGTERHRQTERVHKQGRSQYQQQRRGGKYFSDPGAGDKPKTGRSRKRPPISIPAKAKTFSPTVTQLRWSSPEPANSGTRASAGSPPDPGTAARKTQLAGLAATHSFLTHQLQRHCRGRHRQTNTADHRRLPENPVTISNPPRIPALSTTCAARRQNGAAQAPELSRIQLQSDDEHQEHNAQFGEVQNLIDIANKSQPQGPIAMPASR